MTKNSKAAVGQLGSADDPAQNAVEPTSPSNRIRTIFDLHSRATSSRPTVSIVICTRYRSENLRECLACVAALVPPPDEVIVIDNSSGDAETEYLAKKFDARYLVEEVVGLSRARNRAIQESSCEIVAYLDDDCLPDPEWLEYLLRPFSDTTVAAVAGDISRFREEELECAEPPGISGQIRYVSRETPFWFEMASFGGIGIGTNMAFRKEACLNTVLFDERLGRGAPFQIAEENCAFASLLSKGLSIVRIPTARVRHPEKPQDVSEETKLSIAYWFLLFSKFPENRSDLLHFLLKRIARRPVSWRLKTQQSGIIVSSSWGIRLKALIEGMALFIQARRFRPSMSAKSSLPTDATYSRRRSAP